MKMLRTMVCCTASARSWNTVSMPASRERARVPAGDRLAADEDLAAGRLDHAGEDLDQRRLAGAVVADQADDLAAVDMKIDAAERIDAAVGFRDVAKLDQALGHGRPPPLPREPAGATGRPACDASSAAPSVASSATIS